MWKERSVVYEYWLFNCISSQFQQLGNSKKEYEKSVIVFSIKNQVRFRGNLGKTKKAKENHLLLHYSNVFYEPIDHL